jgi:TPR repeat protein
MNHPQIDYRIGCFYEKGIGVLSSYYKAGLFYQKAAEKNHLEAKDALSALRGY